MKDFFEDCFSPGPDFFPDFVTGEWLVFEFVPSQVLSLHQAWTLLSLALSLALPLASSLTVSALISSV